jgi:glycosyltransferase involved in cell wall biosynthesis
MRKLTIGVASYGNPDGLQKLIASVVRQSQTDWTLLIISNPHPDLAQDEGALGVIAEWRNRMPERFDLRRQEQNIGYVGAVNKILNSCPTEYVAYLDHDVEIMTPAWDEIMAHTLDMFHEVGMVFPGGARRVPRGQYDEIHWGVGCMWMLPIRVVDKVGSFDPAIGHHEEVDYQTRVRLEGLKIAAAHGIGFSHAAKASNDPAAHKRISDGVVRWMNKWTAYFGGKGLNYFSPNVLRHEDWPTSALHLEEYFKLHLPGLNDNPEVVRIEGVEYDLIKVPRYRDFYRGRII